MAGNKSLGLAAKAKEDEFYTQLTDIEKELKHYKEQFKNKIVFCNCDDPEESNFWKYFHLNFKQLQIKKLISTHYDAEKPTYKLEYDGKTIKKTDLQQNGDFRSPECIEILQACDIVCTNPPFSLFREYAAILIENKKDYLIIGSQNNITYKEIFPYLMENKMWLGYNSGDMAFKVPSWYEARNTRYWVDETGQKWRSMGNICWFTNLDTTKRHEELISYKHYTKEEYPSYINYNGIEVNKIADIPLDYNGAMGVPITFMNKYNPEQFEILGIDGGDMGVSYGIGADMTKDEITTLFKEHKGFRRGKLSYRDSNGKLNMCYRRILIRRKK